MASEYSYNPESRPVFPTRYRRPFEDPLRTLCQAYNVGQPLTPYVPASDIPDTIDMEVIYATQMPTHALVILNASRDTPSDATPIIAPIDIFAFTAAFNMDLLRLPERVVTPFRNSLICVPHLDSVRNLYAVTLPTIVVHAADPKSVPLLLLFALWDHLPSPPAQDPTPASSPALPSIDISATSPSSVPSTPPPTPASSNFQSSIAIHPGAALPFSTGLLATYLLPMAIIEEFPSAPNMAETMARTCTPDEVTVHARRNLGLWQNVLAFAPKDMEILQIVRVAWEVSREAYKILERHYEEERARRRAAANAAPPAVAAAPAPAAAPQREHGMPATPREASS